MGAGQVMMPACDLETHDRGKYLVLAGTDIDQIPVAIMPVQPVRQDAQPLGKAGLQLHVILEHHAIFGAAVQKPPRAIEMAEITADLAPAQRPAHIGHRPGWVVIGKFLDPQCPAVKGRDAFERDARLVQLPGG